MLLRGAWQRCDDGVVRPVLRGELQAGDTSRVEVPFLIDTAADRTVLSADVLAALRLTPVALGHQLGGVGGTAESVLVNTCLVFAKEDGGPVALRGQSAAFTGAAALDMSVLGRDVTNLFAVIVDMPGNIVCLVGQRHRYTIEEA